MIKSLINFKDIAFFLNIFYLMTIPLLGVDVMRTGTSSEVQMDLEMQTKNFTPLFIF